jgi:glucose-fructose oxidoreductase
VRKRTRRRSPEPIRYAVVGLGYFAQTAILPAFAHARKNSRLVALFSDTPKKLAALGRRYRVAARHSYEEYDEVLRSGAVDAVYIALPNHLHRDFTVRAARARVHVLCEKPLAVTAADCRAMIAACERTGVKLMTAYRLHFERANLTAAEIVRSGELGEPRVFSSVFSNQVTDPDNIRLDELRRGGGTLYDIGVYCLNAARALFRSEPVEAVALTANNGEARFDGIDEMTAAVLRFPGERLATFVSSFAAHDHNHYEVLGTEGRIKVEPAFEFAEALGWELEIGGRKQKRKLARSDQVAPEILYFSDCILNDRQPEPSGREGLADVRIIEALLRSARTGRRVRLAEFRKPARARLAQGRRRPPIAAPELIAAQPPAPA